jgi:hypothetical protein
MESVLITTFTLAGEQAEVFSFRDCKVVISHENNHWHLSISRDDRYPSWDEIRDVRYDLLPDELYFALILPPRREYVNVHPNCFHLHEIPFGVNKKIVE